MSTLCLLVLLATGVVGALGGVVPPLERSGRLGIYKGESASITDYPYVASVTYMGTAHCTGVILNSEYVLTTADCIDSYDVYYTIVVAGAEVADSGNQLLDVASKSVHPKYNSSTGDYNFGLLQMDGSFSWTDSVANISLPSRRLSNGNWLSIVGYGQSGDSDDNNLLAGKMATVLRQKCEKLYKNADLELSLSNRMGCVYNEGKTTVCDGDFGAPLVKDDVLYYLAASVESTGECSSSALPVITADVFSVVEWINSIINTDSQLH